MVGLMCFTWKQQKMWHSCQQPKVIPQHLIGWLCKMLIGRELIEGFCRLLIGIGGNLMDPVLRSNHWEIIQLCMSAGMMHMNTASGQENGCQQKKNGNLQLEEEWTLIFLGETNLIAPNTTSGKVSSPHRILNKFTHNESSL